MLYEDSGSSDAYGLVSTQFLAALNIYIGGAKELSKEAMTEFFHNFSMQALDVENNEVRTMFHSLTELYKSIIEKLRSDKALMSDKTPDTFVEYSPPEFEEVKERNQRIEEDAVQNIVTGSIYLSPKTRATCRFPILPSRSASRPR